jgi:hypothetical protein
VNQTNRLTYLYLCFRACRQHHISRRSLPVCELAPERPLSVRAVLQALCGPRGRTKPRGEHPFSQTLCLRLRAVRQDAHFTERHELSPLYQTQETLLNFTLLSVSRLNSLLSNMLWYIILLLQVKSFKFLARPKIKFTVVKHSLVYLFYGYS